MKCFIDFDRTLLDSSRLRQDICLAFPGSSEEELEAHHKIFREQEPFTVIGFGNYLTKRGIDGEELCRLFYEHAKKANQYLFDDAKTFLEQLREAEHEPILLTRTMESDVEHWQKPKVDSSGLLPLLHDAHITTTTKQDVIREQNVSEPFVFIDDKQSEIDAMHEAFPNALCLKHEPGAPLLPHLTKINGFIQSHVDLFQN